MGVFSLFADGCNRFHLAFLNPQGNFDPQDRYWTQHPDFGGQLVYVKQVALALGRMGHRVDILTRRIRDPQWPGLEGPLDGYPGAPGVRILRIPAGPDGFLPKEELWPHIGPDWVPGILDFYHQEGRFPDAFTAHYADGGLAGALIAARTGIPFTFTAHSLGAQKMDGLGATPENLAALDARYHFARRLAAERLSMNRSAVNITSTRQERFQQYGHRAYRGAVDVGDDRRFALIPPGVDTAVFDPQARAPDEEAVHRKVLSALERDIRGDRRSLPCIVASSRLEPKKNHLGLVVAFAESPALRERANLLLVTAHLEDPLRQEEGTPAEREILARIREVVRAYGLWGEVSTVALSGQSALAAAYRLLARRRSVFALTAWYEPFGLAPLEAAATGLPVVVTRNGGPAEIWQEDGEEYGVLVDPTDPADIARGLRRLLEDPRAWEAFARRGRKRVLARYTWERTAEGYLNVIRRVLEGDFFRPSEPPLPIPPYFRDPRPENDVSLEELREWYFGSERELPAFIRVHPRPTPSGDLDLLAVGEAVVDLISVEETDSLRDARAFRLYVGGSPANIARTVARLGGRAALAARVGDDPFGHLLRAELEGAGVLCDHLLLDPDARTTVIFVSHTRGTPDFLAYRDADFHLAPEQVTEEAVGRARVVHVSAFALSRPPARYAAERALHLGRERGRILSVDPNYSPRLWPDREDARETLERALSLATLTKPSLDDAWRLFGPGLSPEDCVRRFHELGPSVVVLTMGAEGVLVSEEGRIQHIPALPVPVADATGAGDAFWGGFLVALLDGLPLPDCARFAQHVAARKLAAVGPLTERIDRHALYAELGGEKYL